MVQGILRHFRSMHVLLIFSVAVAAAGDTVPEKPELAGARLERNKFPSRGRQETILRLAAPGYCRLEAKSPQGVRLVLVDRMAGPFAASGITGERDGRMDLLLEAGEYKVLLLAPGQGTGEISLSTSLFQEAQPVEAIERHPVVSEGHLISTELGDLQQRSYWIHQPEDGIFRMELLGRCLTGARLWRDGNWLMDIQPDITTREPVPGQPMTRAEFHHRLEAGYYLLVCYGGPPFPWANGGKEMPLHLRRGIEWVGNNGKRPFRISPFGQDTFLLGDKTDFIQLVRKDKKHTLLTVAPADGTGSRYRDGETASIGKDSRDPWCMIRTSRRQSRWMTVEGTPGDAVELLYFENVDEATLGPDATYWISSLQSAAAVDAIDLTALLVPSWTGVPLLETAVPVGSEKPLLRKVNLLGRTVLFLKFDTPGDYIFRENPKTGARAMYQLTPFMTSRPVNYQPAEFVTAGQVQPVTAGYWILTIQPRSKGILHFALVMRDGVLDGLISGLTDWAAQDEKEQGWLASLVSKLTPDNPLRKPPEPARQHFAWTGVKIGKKESGTIYLNERVDCDAGLLVRRLPMDLSEPLPVPLAAGENIPVLFRLREPAVVTLDGLSTGLEMTRDGFAVQAGDTLPPGDHTLTLRNTGRQAALFTLRMTPVYSPPPPPALQPVEKTATVLAEGKPSFTDFGKEESKFFLIRVKTPGLYQLETTGRMAMAASVRSSMGTARFEAKGNGVARNVLIQQYFKPDVYMFTVRTTGASAGRAGVLFRQTPLDDGGNLEPASVRRRFVPAGSGLRYRFTIPEAAWYRLETAGLNKDFMSRLEEAGGWPVVSPSLRGEQRRYLRPGKYELISLPEPLESRRVTRLQKMEPARAIAGKGPHMLTLNEAVSNRWREEPGRPPDVYRFSVPAPLEADIRLPEEMQAALYRRESETGYKEILPGKKYFQLDPGEYEVRVVCQHESNLVPYNLTVYTWYLVPGLSQPVGQGKDSFWVSVPRDGLVELFSDGGQDLQGELLDRDGKVLLARNDDRQADWNFRISRFLTAGRYRLKVNTAPERPPGLDDVRQPENRRGVRRQQEEPEYGNGGETVEDGGEEPDEGEIGREDEGEGEGESYSENGEDGEPARPAAPPLLRPDLEPERGDIEVELEALPDWAGPAGPRVMMRMRDRQDMSPPGWPFAIQRNCGPEVLQMELSPLPAEGLAMFQAGGGNDVRLSLQKGDLLLGTATGKLAIPLAAGVAYQLAVWREDDGQGEMTVTGEVRQAIAITLAGKGAVSISGSGPWRLDHPDGAGLRFEAGHPPLLFSPGLECPCLPVQQTAEPSGTGAAWLQSGTDDPAGTVKLEALALNAGTPVTAVLGRFPLELYLAGRAQGPWLVEASSSGTPAGAIIFPENRRPAGVYDGSALVMDQARCWAGTGREGQQVLRVWSATGTGPFESEEQRQWNGVPVEIRLHSFSWTGPPLVYETAPLEKPVTPGAAFRVRLPAGGSSLRLWLGREMTAWLDHGEKRIFMMRTAAAGEGRDLPSTGGELVICNGGSTARVFRLENCRDKMAGNPVTDWSAGVERVLRQELRISGLQYQPAGEDPLLLAGVDVRASLLDYEGRLWDAKPVWRMGNLICRQLPGRPGLLEVRAAEGYFRMASGKPEHAARWLWNAPLPEVPASARSVQGDLEQKIQAWPLRVEQPGFYLSWAQAPGLTLLTRGEEVLGSILDGQYRWTLNLLKEGEYTYWTRPVADLAQQGSFLCLPLPVEELTEKSEERLRLICPGEMQVFSFRLDRERLVGAGARAESDGISLFLMDATGEELMRGPLLYRKLEAGTYYLAALGGERPVQYHLAVMGVWENPDAIPADALSQYAGPGNER